MLQLLQKCQSESASSMNMTTAVLKIVNPGSQAIPFSDITVRYWFTHTASTAQPVLEIDFSLVIPRTAITGRFTSNYVEIGFTANAGMLFAFDTTAGSGEIQMRIHLADYSNWNPSEADDWSFQACTGPQFNPWMKTTGYVRGVLAWGTEPP
jgi:hypothetical protein